jgi:hypothetical protein
MIVCVCLECLPNETDENEKKHGSGGLPKHCLVCKRARLNVVEIQLMKKRLYSVESRSKH